MGIHIPALSFKSFVTSGNLLNLCISVSLSVDGNTQAYLNDEVRNTRNNLVMHTLCSRACSYTQKHHYYTPVTSSIVKGEEGPSERASQWQSYNT